MTKELFNSIFDGEGEEGSNEGNPSQILDFMLYNVNKNEVLRVSAVQGRKLVLSPVFLTSQEGLETVMDVENCENYEELGLSFKNLDPHAFAAVMAIKNEMDRLASKFNF